MIHRTLASIALIAGFAASQAVSQNPVSAVVVFGDSLSDTGNLSLATGGVYASAPYFNGRASNGPLWVDHLAAALEVPRVAPSLVGGPNQAWAGAESGNGVSSSGTPDIGLQVQMFLQTVGSLAGDELIVLWGGANDALQSSSTPEQAARNLGDHVMTLAFAGGRRFLVLDLAGIERTPALAGTAFEQPTAVWLDEFQDELEDTMDDVQDALEDLYDDEVCFVEFEVGEFFVEMLDDPEDFGFTNATDPACPGCNTGLPDPSAGRTVVSNPDEYVFWDLVHPTRVVHEFIGEEAAELVQDALEDDADDDDDSDDEECDDDDDD